MQKIRTLLFPALTLCFLLVLGGFFLGRRSVGGVLLTTQHPAPAAAENQSQALTETHDRALSPAPEAAASCFDAQGRLELNRASLDELMTLPGIGEARAKLILDYRAENGPFQSASDLMRVRGIGEGIFGKLRDLIYVEDCHENTDH